MSINEPSSFALDGIALEDGQLYPVFLKLPPDNIVLLKFILEGYDGLGIARTLDPDRGELVILALKDTVQIVVELLESIRDQLNVHITPPPESVEGDWLLAEYVRELRESK